VRTRGSSPTVRKGFLDGFPVGLRLNRFVEKVSERIGLSVARMIKKLFERANRGILLDVIVFLVNVVLMTITSHLSGFFSESPVIL
jgi:hypothetical protein